MPTTPTAITPTVLAFCKQVSQHDPLYVSVEPMNGAKHGECYSNVHRKIQSDGGTILHGWCIWEESTFFIEAEHHAIWVSPEGEKVDVTWQNTGERRILFLPDPEKVWNRILIPNRRHALTDDPRLQEFLALADELDEFRLKGVQPDGRYFVPIEERMRIELTQLRLQMEMGMPLPQAVQEMLGIPHTTRNERRKLRKKSRRDRRGWTK